MDIFISWSGDISKQIAAALRNWLPSIIQAIKPFYTESDIEKGKYWMNEISVNLNNTDFGLLCMTHDNLDSNWLHFEAGALAKNLKDSNVIPIAFGGLKVTDIKEPLGLLQGIEFTGIKMRELLGGINNKLGDNKLGSQIIDDLFEVLWPRLEKRIKDILDSAEKTTGPKKPTRYDRDIQEEMLTILRRIDRGTSSSQDLVFQEAGRIAKKFEAKRRSNLEQCILAALDKGEHEVMFFWESNDMLTLYMNEGIPAELLLKCQVLGRALGVTVLEDPIPQG